MMFTQDGRGPEQGRALVVDDDEDIRCVLASALSDEGYAVRAVGDGAAALGILRGQPGGWVVLLDWMMPQVDGQETLRTVAADPVLRDGNAYILMTAGGRTLPLAVARLLDELGVIYLAKPFDLDLLLSTVARAAARLDASH